MYVRVSRNCSINYPISLIGRMFGRRRKIQIKTSARISILGLMNERVVCGETEALCSSRWEVAFPTTGRKNSLKTFNTHTQRRRREKKLSGGTPLRSVPVSKRPTVSLRACLFLKSTKTESKTNWFFV